MERLTFKNWKELQDQGDVYNRLAELEDKLESGQLVELPCNVGDTVFVLRSGAGSPLHIEEDKIIGFDILQNTVMAHGKYGHAYSEVFLTKPEAEARLKELQSK